jgi:hypothetical protein
MVSDDKPLKRRCVPAALKEAKAFFEKYGF